MDKDLELKLDGIQEELLLLQNEVAKLREAIAGGDLSAVVHSLDTKTTRILDYLEHRAPPFD